MAHAATPTVGVGAVALLASDVVLPVPASIVMTANGVVFGLVVGTLLSTIGATLSALAGHTHGSHYTQPVTAMARIRHGTAARRTSLPATAWSPWSPPARSRSSRRWSPSSPARVACHSDGSWLPPSWAWSGRRRSTRQPAPWRSPAPAGPRSRSPACSPSPCGRLATSRPRPNSGPPRPRCPRPRPVPLHPPPTHRSNDDRHRPDHRLGPPADDTATDASGRDVLVQLLNEAAKLEHCLLDAYLYTASSIKSTPQEFATLPDGRVNRRRAIQFERARLWKKMILEASARGDAAPALRRRPCCAAWASGRSLCCRSVISPPTTGSWRTGTRWSGTEPVNDGRGVEMPGGRCHDRQPATVRPLRGHRCAAGHGSLRPRGPPTLQGPRQSWNCRLRLEMMLLQVDDDAEAWPTSRTTP